MIAGIGIGVFAGMQLGDNAQQSEPQETPVSESIPSPANEPTELFSRQAEDNVEEIASNTGPVTEPVVQPAAADPETSPAARMLAASDEWLRTGYFSRAMTGFDVVLKNSKAASKESIQFRIALCREFLGEVSAAQQQYRSLARTTTFRSMRSMAQLGEARCLAARGQTELLKTQFLPMALLDESAFPEQVTGEFLHLIARAMMLAARQAEPQSAETKSGKIDTLAIPKLSPNPGDVLQQLASMRTDDKLDLPVFQVLQNAENSPDSCFVRVNQPRVGVLSLLTSMLQECGFESQISSTVLTTIQGHGQSLIVSDKSLSLILDGVCLRFGLVWRVTDTTISFMTLDEAGDSVVAEFNSAMTERLLRWAIISSSESYQSHSSQLLLGVVHYDRAEYVDAAHVFQVYLERHPHTMLTGLAAFNLAKCYVRTNQLTEAEESLLRGIDHTHSTFDTRIAAYMYLGRLRLESGQLQEAVSTLIRGLSQSHGHESEAAIGLLLSSAYLLADNPHAANSVLMERRSLFVKPQQQAAAAFLSAYCRLRRAAEPSRVARETQAVVTALAHFRPAKMQGKHWYLLTASAYEDIGLRSNAIGTYTTAIKDELPGFVMEHCCTQLAELYAAEGQLAKAEELFKAVPSKEGTQIFAQTMLSRARLAFQNDDLRSTIEFASKVARSNDDESTVRQALRILGETYEKQGNHLAAVYCFAGMVPDSETSVNVQQTSHSSPLPIEGVLQ